MKAEGDGAGMPVDVPPATPIPETRLPLTPAPSTGVGKDVPGVVIGTIVGVKHEQYATTPVTTYLVSVPRQQQSPTWSMVEVTIFTGEPVDVVGPIYG